MYNLLQYVKPISEVAPLLFAYSDFCPFFHTFFAEYRNFLGTDLTRAFFTGGSLEYFILGADLMAANLSIIQSDLIMA